MWYIFPTFPATALKSYRPYFPQFPYFLMPYFILEFDDLFISCQEGKIPIDHVSIGYCQSQRSIAGHRPVFIVSSYIQNRFKFYLEVSRTNHRAALVS